jgi:hypothetical protein
MVKAVTFWQLSLLAITAILLVTAAVFPWDDGDDGDDGDLLGIG